MCTVQWQGVVTPSAAIIVSVSESMPMLTCVPVPPSATPASGSAPPSTFSVSPSFSRVNPPSFSLSWASGSSLASVLSSGASSSSAAASSSGRTSSSFSGSASFALAGGCFFLSSSSPLSLGCFPSPSPTACESLVSPDRSLVLDLLPLA